MLDYKSYGGNVALKFDIKKAFDTMDWSFLLQALSFFGFSPIFCNWIQVVLHPVKLSLSINGKPIVLFSYKIGVRQGDPLSPCFFALLKMLLEEESHT